MLNHLSGPGLLTLTLALGSCGPGRAGVSPVPNQDTVATPSRITVSDTEVGLAGSPENATAIRLGNLVLHVSRYGQAAGALPLELEPVLANSSRAASQATDLWGRRARYSPAVRSFELRSAGADGEFATQDDIWVRGELGRDAPCETHIKDRRIDYSDIGPPCTSSPAIP